MSRTRLHLKNALAFLGGVVAVAIATGAKTGGGGLVVFELLLDGVGGLALAFEVIGVVLLNGFFSVRL